jgi:hypothetical protein
MTPEALKKFFDDFNGLKLLVLQVIKPDRYLFNRRIELLSNEKTIRGLLYAGSVASDGTAIRLPQGWTSSRTSTGLYTITHNLGTTNYAPIVTAFLNGGTGFRAAQVHTQSANSFVIDIAVSGTDTDSSFSFVVILT